MEVNIPGGLYNSPPLRTIFAKKSFLYEGLKVTQASLRVVGKAITKNASVFLWLDESKAYDSIHPEAFY